MIEVALATIAGLYLVVFPPDRKLMAGTPQAIEQYDQVGIAQELSAITAKLREKSAGTCRPIDDQRTRFWPHEGVPHHIALTILHRAPITEYVDGRTVPGDDIPEWTHNIGRASALMIEDALKMWADR